MENEERQPDEGAPEGEPAENEMMREARLLKEAKAARTQSAVVWKTAAGIGIGSAAIAAALIFANRGRKDRT